LEEQAEEAAEDEGEDEGEGEDGEDGEEVAEVQACEPAPPPPGAGEEKPTFDEPAQVLEDGVDYRAVITTSCGEVVIDLLEERAPETVNNFVFLAQEGFFDGLEIFRNATSISALQTGAGNNDAGWQVGYTLSDELEAAEEEGYPPGSVAMANSGPDSAGSQFFFVYGEFGLEPSFAKFGQTVEGLDVLRSIGAIEAEGETPLKDVYMESVTIETE
ncbi:MAG: peptidylprolyl isomerase, partial [Egibacteraceae bacterium]